MIKENIKSLLSFGGYEIINNSVLGNNLIRDIVGLVNKGKMLTIFDIGANLGQTSLELVENFKNSRIYSFEPDAETFATLIEKTKNYDNIFPFNVGLGESKGELELFINKVSGGNSFLNLSKDINKFAKGDWTENIGTQKVEVTTLNSFCQQKAIHNIDILKMDTQGYELKIIEGGDKVIVPSVTKIVYLEVLFVELYEKQAYFIDIYKTLTSRGYRLLGLYNKFHKVEKPHYLLWCDAVFVCD